MVSALMNGSFFNPMSARSAKSVVKVAVEDIFVVRRWYGEC